MRAFIWVVGLVLSAASSVASAGVIYRWVADPGQNMDGFEPGLIEIDVGAYRNGYSRGFNTCGIAAPCFIDPGTLPAPANGVQRVFVPNIIDLQAIACAAASGNHNCSVLADPNTLILLSARYMANIWLRASWSLTFGAEATGSFSFLPDPADDSAAWFSNGVLSWHTPTSFHMASGHYVLDSTTVIPEPGMLSLLLAIGLMGVFSHRRGNRR